MYMLDYHKAYILTCCQIFTMPTITVYLNDELYDFVKGRASEVIQNALMDYKKKVSKKEKPQI